MEIWKIVMDGQHLCVLWCATKLVHSLRIHIC